MRSIVALVTLIFSLSACAESSAPTKEYQAGKDYQVLSQPVPTSVSPDKIEVTEVFWYGCGHCFHFEPMIQAWQKKLGEDVAFVHSPAMWSKPMEIHAQAFYTAKALGVLDKLHQPLFNAINISRKHLTTEEELAALFVEHGVAREDFVKTFNSFGVMSQVRQADARARGYGITGTPEMVVEGKYRVTSEMTGSQEGMLKVVNYLIEKERQARAH